MAHAEDYRENIDYDSAYIAMLEVDAHITNHIDLDHFFYGDFDLDDPVVEIGLRVIHRLIEAMNRESVAA